MDYKLLLDFFQKIFCCSPWTVGCQKLISTYVYVCYTQDGFLSLGKYYVDINDFIKEQYLSLFTLQNFFAFVNLSFSSYFVAFTRMLAWVWFAHSEKLYSTSLFFIEPPKTLAGFFDTFWKQNFVHKDVFPCHRSFFGYCTL